MNSEKAALAAAIALYDKCGTGKKAWRDPDFGPTEEDEHGALSLYYTGETPRDHPEVEDVFWHNPAEFIEEEDEEGNKTDGIHFMKGDAASNEVIQGQLGNCWFISALSVLADRDDMLRGGGEDIDTANENMVDKSTSQLCTIGVYPPLFHKFRQRGIFVFRFFKDYKWRYVLVDELLPYANCKLCFAHCTKPDETWVPMIEKAYAKLFGCYEALRSGSIDEAIVDMTGLVCEKIALFDAKGKFKFEDADEFWERLLEYSRNGSLMGCSRSGGTEHALEIEGEKCGILTGHAYGLNKVINLPCQDCKRNRSTDCTHRLLLVRNPHG